MAESTNTKSKKDGGDLEDRLRNLHVTDAKRKGVFLVKEDRENLPKKQAPSMVPPPLPKYIFSTGTEEVQEGS